MRSFLFVPADSEKKMEKGLTSGADALIVDLEDSVALERKAEGRALTLRFLKEKRRAEQSVFVRINPIHDPLALEDLAAVMAGAPDGIVLPKCQDEEDVWELGNYLSALEVREGLEKGTTRILPVATETAASVFGLPSYTQDEGRLYGLCWGAEDLSADLGASEKRNPDGTYKDVYRLARSHTLLASVAAGVAPIDTVFIDFRDDAGLEAECIAARKEGFVAKAAIHPQQVPIINQAFSVTPEEILWAEEVVKAFSENPGAGVIGLKGVMLDRPHLRQAEKILKRAQS